MLLVGCSNHTQIEKKEVSDTGTVQQACQISSGKEQIIKSPIEITNKTIDINDDGVNENVHVILKEGKINAENQYVGKFTVQLRDKDEKVISEIVINKEDDITLRKNFDIVFKDYDNNGSKEFNIGYQSKHWKDEFIYQFYRIEDNINERVEKLERSYFGITNTFIDCWNSFVYFISNRFSIFGVNHLQCLDNVS